MANKKTEKKVVTEEEKKKVTDEDLLYQMIKETETDYYTFGAYTDYNNLDVKNLKNPIFDK